ncbi:MAG TPA: hypothetical protein DCW29_07090 [Janthinobacterium sp.]|nr:hypothetical protein [Janthinobacterium sp.]
MARLWLTLTLFLCAMCGLARAQIAVPPLVRPVTDLSATLSGEQVARLESTLRAFEARKGSQIAVLIVPTTRPEAIEQYAIRVAEQWKIGRKKVDDGAILVVAKNDRTLRVEVGYGLEGALNDAISKRIIDEIIVPRFQQDDFYGGIAAGVDKLMTVIEGEPLPPASPTGRGEDELGLRQLLPVALVMAVVLGGILRAALGRVAGAAVTGGVIGVAAWLIAGAAFFGILAGFFGFLFTLTGAGRMGMAGLLMGHGRRGGGGWSGGGGGFGGGGASGRW